MTYSICLSKLQALTHESLVSVKAPSMDAGSPFAPKKRRCHQYSFQRKKRRTFKILELPEAPSPKYMGIPKKLGCSYINGIISTYPGVGGSNDSDRLGFFSEMNAAVTQLFLATAERFHRPSETVFMV